MVGYIFDTCNDKRANSKAQSRSDDGQGSHALTASGMFPHDTSYGTVSTLNRFNCPSDSSPRGLEARWARELYKLPEYSRTPMRHQWLYNNRFFQLCPNTARVAKALIKEVPSYALCSHKAGLTDLSRHWVAGCLVTQGLQFGLLVEIKL